ncbi:MAG: hypothetical protein PHT88_05060 [Candidatus Moranbacteria bacterium]|nr:hypothetical protein [Candidatus Moranbacteria bacterium]
MKTPAWFPKDTYTSIEIKQYKSIANPRIMQSALITEPDMIERVMARIKEIPTDGEMKVVFDSKAEKMDMRFDTGTISHLIEVFDRRFKTPAGGFHTGRNAVESTLYADLDTLIHPARKKKFAKLRM